MREQDAKNNVESLRDCTNKDNFYYAFSVN